jgi:hypothetical protein
MRHASHMTLSKSARRDCFSEAEAAEALGITVVQLHHLLDRFVFNEGTRRPANIEFTASDLVLLAYWNKGSRPGSEPHGRDNVVSIENRKRDP